MLRAIKSSKAPKPAASKKTQNKDPLKQKPTKPLTKPCFLYKLVVLNLLIHKS